LVRRATSAGCYFSVNGAMSDEALRRIPPDRMLPETDFPSTSRRGGGTKPGDTRKLEERVAGMVGLPTEQIRWTWYRNLRTISLASGAIERLPDQLADRLLGV
jgi:TatD DNase family protein